MVKINRPMTPQEMEDKIKAYADAINRHEIEVSDLKQDKQKTKQQKVYTDFVALTLEDFEAKTQAQQIRIIFKMLKALSLQEVSDE